MFGKSQFLTAIVAVVVAVGAGQFMQNSAERSQAAAEAAARADDWVPLPTRLESPITGVMVTDRARLVPEPTIETEYLAVPHPPRSAFANAALPRARLARLSAPTDAMMVPPGDHDMHLDGFGMSCDTQATASPAPGAVAMLRLSAPCAPGAEVAVAYSGLNLRVRLDAAGLREIALPALSETEEIVVRFPDGPTIRNTVRISDADAFRRIALAWEGSGKLSIHALEFGANPGSAGHISAARTQAGSAPGAGRIVALGDAGLDDAARAEIYSFPSGHAPEHGTVRLSVAVEVTSDICGKALAAKMIRSQDHTAPGVADLEIQMPDCAEVGNILVLKNLLGDLKIAHN